MDGGINLLGRIGIPATAVWWVAIASAVMFGLTLLAIPWLITRIPVDYFDNHTRTVTKSPFRSMWIRWLWLIVKNVLGLGFLFFGLLMLVLPGQGILTVLIALTLLDFPGKFRLQRRVVALPGVLDAMNWIRKRRGKAPLALGP